MRKLIFPAVLLLAGCAGVPDTPPEFEPTLPEAWNEPVTPTGGIFHAGREIALFQDPTAFRPGDILTIRLVEQTTAQKSASTSTSKATSGSSDFPNVFGRPVTRNGIAILSSEYESNREFSGEGDSSQSNRLEGEITVTVAERLANGNLVVRGEKWLTINQGSELVRFSGIVRPADINADNTVPSYKVANARISYTGKGALADANSQGWLARFFNSPWMPW